MHQGSAAANGGCDVDGFGHLFRIGAFLQAGLRVRVNAVRALNGMRDRQRNQAFFAFRKRSFREDRGVPFGKLAPQLRRVFADIGEMRKVFRVVISCHRFPILSFRPERPALPARISVHSGQRRVMRYRFLVDTYETEILKVLSVWSMFEDGDLKRRPGNDGRGRSPLEHMVHQCVSENLWFSNMLGIDVTECPLPAEETRLGFLRQYAHDASRRKSMLAQKPDDWWEEDAAFFEVRRSRAWIVTRRLTHTAHHRGQQTALLRMLGRDLHSTYGPTADTGGLMANHAPVIYAYADA